MVNWSHLWGGPSKLSGRDLIETTRRLLPSSSHDLPPSGYHPKEVTKIAIRMKYQVEQVIPCELEESKITQANSPIITPKVVQTAREAGGEEYKACVVYCLLICQRWFQRQSNLELWDSGLLDVRATACEVIAKIIIEEENDQDFLLHDLLLKRFSILRDGQQTNPANVVERAVDLHSLRVTGSSGYQKAIKYLWKGWIVQSEQNAETFTTWKGRDNLDYWSHFDANRMRTPLYQNIVHVIFSLIYLGMYTGAVNTMNNDGDIDVVEWILYVMTLGYICDEATKFWKVGWYYFGFWNAFHIVLYAILTISFGIRVAALTHSPDNDEERRRDLNVLGYNFFATAAPMFWARLLLHLDSFRFFGTMLVVLKVMMRESIIFFVLLVLICVGFLQSFLGFNQTEPNGKVAGFMIQALADAIMGNPDFGSFDKFAPPFGMILYYIYTFVVMVILLNILVALYNSAYSEITDRADDEYMALFAQKTIKYVRAPDENVFIAPFNLIEIFCLVLPFEWWMEAGRYERLNTTVMSILYSPLLVFTSFIEVKEAKRVRSNRRRGEADDDTVEEWEQLDEEAEFEGHGWSKWTQKVEETKPDVANDQAVIEIRELKKQVEELARIVQRLSPEPETK